MNQPKKFFLLVVAFVFCLNIFEASAQTPLNKLSESSFDVVLQTITASNDSNNKSDIAPALSNVIKKLKTEFPFSNYRLTSTAFQRIGNKANAESRSVSFISDRNLAVFSEWVVNGLESSFDENGRENVQIQGFRFGQRLPIINQNNSVNYEQIGLTARFSLAKNTPTIVGSLATSKPDELMFLILTVKSAEK